MSFRKILEPKSMPWKNGGGTTTEFAIHPPTANLENFEWRLSSAEIQKSGPFSSFPGYRRFISVIEGAGFELKFKDRIVRLARYAVYEFSGDESVQCSLLDQRVRDLNFIFKNSVKASYEVFQSSTDHTVTAPTCLIVCLSGETQVETLRLAALESARQDTEAQSTKQVRCSTSGAYALIQIS